MKNIILTIVICLLSVDVLAGIVTDVHLDIEGHIGAGTINHAQYSVSDTNNSIIHSLVERGVLMTTFALAENAPLRISASGSMANYIEGTSAYIYQDVYFVPDTNQVKIDFNGIMTTFNSNDSFEMYVIQTPDVPTIPVSIILFEKTLTAIQNQNINESNVFDVTIGAQYHFITITSLYPVVGETSKIDVTAVVTSVPEPISILLISAGSLYLILRKEIIKK